jgi:hypothetical protein
MRAPAMLACLGAWKLKEGGVRLERPSLRTGMAAGGRAVSRHGVASVVARSRAAGGIDGTNKRVAWNILPTDSQSERSSYTVLKSAD